MDGRWGMDEKKMTRAGRSHLHPSPPYTATKTESTYLWSGDDDCAVNLDVGKGLDDRNVFVRGPGGCVDDEVVELAPNNVAEKLRDHCGFPGASPHDWVVLRPEEKGNRHDAERRLACRIHRNPP